MVDDLEILLPSFKGQKTRVRCFAHILNLVVKVMLSQFSKTNKASSDDDLEEADHDRLKDLEDSTGVGDEEIEGAETADETDPSVEASDKAVVEGVVADVELDGRLPPLTRDEVNLGRFSVLKVGHS
jgi:hypothetical protein